MKHLKEIKMDRQNPVKDTGSSMHNAELHNHHFCLFGFFNIGSTLFHSWVGGNSKGHISEQPGADKVPHERGSLRVALIVSALNAPLQNQELTKARFISILSMVIQLSNYS